MHLITKETSPIDEEMQDSLFHATFGSLCKIIYIHNCPRDNNERKNTKLPLSDLYTVSLNVYYISQMAIKENQPVILDLIHRFSQITFKINLAKYQEC